MRNVILAFLGLIVLGFWPLAGLAQDSDRTARIGVLAFRGAQSAQDSWRNLARYLSGAVDGWRFEIVPVTLVSAPRMIKARRIDFLITNPGHFVVLARDHPLSALATRERLVPGSAQPGLLTFGTAIFVRKGSGIRTIADLRGKNLAAVSPDAFGGFQVAWDELRRQGVDPFTDLDMIHFMGFPQDSIVTSVAGGDMDAGVIRSGLLERMQAEGRIDLADFDVLDSRSQPGFPYLVSGHLYPEWPFLALPWIDKPLRENVTLALLGTQDPDIRARFALLDIWSAPLSYDGVRALVGAFQARGANGAARGAWMPSIPVFAAFFLGILLAGLFGGAAWMMTRRWAVPPSAPAPVPPAPVPPAPVPSAPVPSAPAPQPPPDDPQTIEARARFDSLTRREREILLLICAGQASKAIAEELGISPKTVEFHRANLLQKTQAGTTAHLVQVATRLGFDQGFSPGQTSQ